MTIHHWGEKTGTVIHNGVKLKKVDVISMDVLQIRKTYKQFFVCSSNWHAQKRLKKNIELFFKLKQHYPHSCLVVMGSNPDYVVNHKDVIYTGPLSHQKCLEMFSAADWMIHLAWLDHCPNVVVEALSQNCPVICTDSGGTQEIVGSNGIIVPESIIYNYELTDYDKPYDLEMDIFKLPEIDVNNQYLDIGKVACQYIKILEK
jgi:glycosyltransferase involved in cell wall biosynthesis